MITSGDLNTVRYGNYIFTSTGKEVCGDTTKLTGYIRMNGWLGFQDSVQLEGDLKKDPEVLMRCRRSYVQYDRNTAKDMQSILQSMECMLPFRDFRK